jgi:membrane fusion protein (multidrug efflux system)
VGDEWIIEKGLVAGERVVVDGVQRVQPGMTVDPVPVSTVAAAGQGAAAAAKAAASVPAKTK